ncbi:MAG TPA: ABC transporter substrate-binding protein [Geminicoccaceae bacterium]|nr:ABC transporter substrate-binding protein [Geminicoccaceae bacterium]
MATIAVGLRTWLAGAALVLVGAAAQAAGLGEVRVGVLQFGTVSWELDVIEHHGLDAAEGFDLRVQGYASGEATNVALQGGAVDAIVDDWLWVSRQRADGKRLVFLPFSTAVGALMVPPESDVQDLADLEGRRLGVAGGPVDKSWLLVRALAAERHGGMDLAGAVELAYGAPPLLNQKALSGELDAVLTYWNFAARLEARGFRELVGVEEAVKALGIGSEVPQLGYVFREAFADDNPELLAAFARASRAAKVILAESDGEWARIRPLTGAEDDATFEALKARFREGIPERWGEAERADAAELYRILARLGGERLVGSATELAEGTFWAPVSY